MKIKVFETAEGYKLYENQANIITAINKTLPGATVLIAETAGLRISNTFTGGAKAINSEKDAYRYLSGILANINNSMGKDETLIAARIPPIFPKELSIRSAVTTTADSGMKTYQLVFDVRKKPSAAEKSCKILNAELQATINAEGYLSDLYLCWRPLLSEKSIDRLPLRMAGSLYRKNRRNPVEVVYTFYPEKKYIIPLYKVLVAGAPFYLPATRYFN